MKSSELPQRIATAAAVTGLVLLINSFASKRFLPQLQYRSPSPKPGVLFIFGLGYSGKRAGQYLKAQGWEVRGTTRQQSSIPTFYAMGIKATVFADASHKEAVEQALQGVTHVLVTCPPGEDGDPVLAHFTSALQSLDSLVWVGYMSTVGVYGDCQGAEVNEETPVNPISERGRRRVKAENAWKETGLPLHILRLPGIYGPGRGPLEKVRTGTARMVDKKGHVFSRIHVDDIVLATCCSMSQPTPYDVFNVVDDLPAAGHVVTKNACDLLGVTPPPLVDFENANLTPMGRSFYSESRVVRNTKMKATWGINLHYPTYKEGQRAQLAEEIALGICKDPRTSVAKFVTSGFSKLLAPLQGRGRWLLARGTPSLPAPRVLLVDNGSFRPGSTLALRRTAKALNALLPKGYQVYPVSARWSDRVDANALEGTKAQLFFPLMQSLADEGHRHFVILPLFLGPSGTVTEFLPKQAHQLLSFHQSMNVRVAPCIICHCPFLFPNATGQGDKEIASILAEKVRKTITKNGLTAVNVVMADHGTPTPSVGRVREYVKDALALELGSEVVSVEPCSMEKREGPEYAFNDPLLEDLLMTYSEGDVVVSLMFLQPGKHAGEGGDIAEIVQKVQEQRPNLNIHITDVIGSHPVLIDLLAKRVNQSIPLTMLPTPMP